MTIWAVLGDIRIDAIHSPSAMGVKYAANYAEQTLINRKSTLQFTGFAPDDINWSIELYAAYGDPNARLKQFKDHFDAKHTLSLTMGNGEYRGVFVITEISVQLEHTAPDGTVLGLGCSLSLKEYTGDPVQPNAPGVIKEGKPAIEAITEPTVLFTEPPGGFIEMLDTAVATVQAVGEAAGKVNAIVQAAQDGDLLQATALAGSYAPRLAELAEILPVEDVSQLQEVAVVAADAGQVAHGLAVTRNSVNQAAALLEQSPNLSGLSSAAGHMEHAVNTSSTLDVPLARMRAYGDTGSRLGAPYQSMIDVGAIVA